MKELKVELGERSYNIFIDKGIFDNIGAEIRKIYKGKKVALITDKNVNNLYGCRMGEILKEEGFQVSSIVVVPGESSKSLKTLQKVYEELFQFEIDRGSLIIAFGGGVVGDLAGFAASTFLRGVSFVQIPTTLLSQVDSSVGGKTAVNLENGKNLVGSFYQPKAVFIDPNFLKTLDNKFIIDGLGEVIKYACIRSINLFNNLMGMASLEELMDNMEEIIYECVSIKSEIVIEDEKDNGIRNVLNFGHTIGHGIEALYNYKLYSHGEAVSIGMYIITKISEKLELTAEGTTDKLKELLEKFYMVHEVNLTVNEIDKIIEIIKHDKKMSSGLINIVLIKKIGEVFTIKKDTNFIKESLCSNII